LFDDINIGQFKSIISSITVLWKSVFFSSCLEIKTIVWILVGSFQQECFYTNLILMNICKYQSSSLNLLCSRGVRSFYRDTVTFKIVKSQT